MTFFLTSGMLVSVEWDQRRPWPGRGGYSAATSVGTDETSTSREACQAS